ncbi:MAG: LytTR family DNA-binding domain-containing protein [Saprospiraceae bacterium]|nr:LytTR family DNA-binding domain-containing protein [Saprospiraceae bacterium]
MSEKVKCLIVDDEPLALQLIQAHIERLPQLEIVAACQNALEAFELLKKEQIDLVFLDIQMPVLTGIEFVKSLQHPPSIIFTTAYREYAVESYELEVVDYLLKPITFTRFFKAINKYLNQNQAPPPVHPSPTPKTSTASTEDTFLYVNANKKRIKVWFQDVEYIESLKDYIRIHHASGSITTKEKISEFERKLPPFFLRIHRSFIVNTQKITAYTAHDVEIKEKEIPIGGSYKKEVFEKLGG